MKYENIKNSIEELDRTLRKRDEFIRSCAQSLLTQLTGEKLGFPKDALCLQGVTNSIEDEKVYHPEQLPTDYSDGRRGFRVRFVMERQGYLSGGVVIVSWVFAISGEQMIAQITGETETFECDINRPRHVPFIDTLVQKTMNKINDTIIQMTSDPSVQSQMGFHQLSGES